MIEVNLVRKNPKNYFNANIKDKMDWYDGTPYQHQAKNFNEHEGYSSLKTDMLKLDKDLGQLNWKDGLYQCCKDHSDTQGATQQTGHNRTNGNSWNTEIQKYGTFTGAGENISYGMTTARNIVIQLLLDDGVTSRGHRENILKEVWTDFGSSYGTHGTYGNMCVQNFATNWVDKE